MNNTTQTLEELFNNGTFYIPDYQRAYAWETDPHLKNFLEDLRQQTTSRRGNANKHYFLGSILLHKEDKDKFAVVDGQQRMTSSVIFIAAALSHLNQDNKAKHLNTFITSADTNRQRFSTIHIDNTFFYHNILTKKEATLGPDSRSSQHLKEAYEYFENEVKTDEWQELVVTLINARVMVYEVSTQADATLIFELQNDRGKRLTNLEVLKSYLMHALYLNSQHPDESIGHINDVFAKIYRIIEDFPKDKRTPTDDAVLSYHCAAYLDWKEDEWRRPKDLIKKTMNLLDEHKTKEEWILQFVCNLLTTYTNVNKLIKDPDAFTEFLNLYLLDRMASFWPLLIKTYEQDTSTTKDKFIKSCGLMEVYALRGYGVSNLRSDAGVSQIYQQAKNFNGKFIELYKFLYELSGWWDLPRRWEQGLDRAKLYDTNRRDVLYILWRYENHLRQRRGQQAAPLSWRDYANPPSDAAKLSIEHIAAKNNPISDTEVEWEAGIPEKFCDVCTHRLGNLVLDSKSSNSAKGYYDFTDKLEYLEQRSTFLSQGEIRDKWAKFDNESKQYIWTIESVRERHEHLKKFALDTWDPKKHYIPKSPSENDEPEMIESDSDLSIMM